MSDASTIAVLIGGRRAGTITQQDSSGSLNFQYEEDYKGPILSLSMPDKSRIYGDKAIRTFLRGCLPDDAPLRRAMGSRFDVSGGNPAELLAYAGWDCAGGVQFCLPVDAPRVAADEGEEIPLNSKELSLRVAALARPRACWQQQAEAWTLGGQTPKLALRQAGVSWRMCQGAVATTHVLKLADRSTGLSAVNEYVCLKLAQACGIPAVDASLHDFNGIRALVSERYDRALVHGGKMARVHQETLCQAMGVLPTNKAPEVGGPDANAIIALLKKTGSNSKRNVQMFTLMLFFNYLIGGVSAHAMNYSLIHEEGKDPLLAPLTDIASGFEGSSSQVVKVSLGIGNEYLTGHLNRAMLRRFVHMNGLEDYELSETTCAKVICGMAAVIPTKLAEVFDGMEDATDVYAMRDALEKPIADSCRNAVAALSR